MPVRFWTPDELSLAFWGDTLDTSATNIVQSGGLVSQWSDKSGNGNHAVQSSGSLQPAFNSGRMQFNSTGKIFQVTNDPFKGMQNPCIVMLGRWDGAVTWGNTFVSYLGEGTTGWQVRQRGANIADFCFTLRTVPAVSTTDAAITSTNTDFFIGSTYRRDTSTRIIKHNGTQEYLANDTGTVGYAGTDERSAIGGRYNADNFTSPNANLNGSIKAMVVLDDASDADVERIEGWMAWRYGEQGLLPANHPYKNAAPTISRFSTEAQNYFDRLDTAGDTTYAPYKQPLANYIDSLVSLGGAYWDTMLSSTSFVGVGIQGVTVPLRDGMPTLTNNNFVAGDLDQLTGLKGDFSTKYIATNVAGNAPSQNDVSVSVYVKEAQTVGGGFLLGNQLPSIGLRANATQWLNGSTALGTTPTPGLYGAARSTSTDIDVRSNATDYSAAVTSTAPNSGVISLFALGTTVSTNARLATYHVGPALNLATLEGLQDTLLSEIAGVGLSAQAMTFNGQPFFFNGNNLTYNG